MKSTRNEIAKHFSAVSREGQERNGGKEEKEEVRTPHEQEKKDSEPENSKPGVKRLQPEDSDEEYQFDLSAFSKAMKKLKAMNQNIKFDAKSDMSSEDEDDAFFQPSSLVTWLIVSTIRNVWL